MTISANHLRRTAPGRATGRRLARPGRSEVVVAVLVACIGVFMLVATARMHVTSALNYLGPRFVPAVTGGLLVVLGAALAVRVYLATRKGVEPVEGEDSTAEHNAEASAERTPQGSDWKPLSLTLASLAVHVLLLQTAGWIIAGALLFWSVSYALGSRKMLRDLGISFIVSCAVQVAFSTGLGLTLPPGILIGLF